MNERWGYNEHAESDRHQEDENEREEEMKDIDIASDSGSPDDD